MEVARPLASMPGRYHPGTARAAATRRHVPCLPPIRPPIPAQAARQRFALSCVLLLPQPHLSRAVLRPRCARARPAPGAPWSAMSNGLDAETRFPSSPLRGSPDADARLRRCHTSGEALPVVRTWLPRSAACAPAAPALRPRDRGSQCRRSFPASQGHEARHQRCHASCWGNPTRNRGRQC